MKFYITNYDESTLLHKVIDRFGYDVDLIKNYDGESGFFIINTREVHNDYWNSFLNNPKLIFLLDDSCEGYSHILRLEYTRFYDVLDEYGVNRNRGIICYNNAHSTGVTNYIHKGQNINTLYIPIFTLWPFSAWKNLKEEVIPKYDYSYFVRNGRQHKKEGYLKIKEKELKNVFITYKKNLGEVDDMIFHDEVDGLLDEFKFHLRPEIYLNTKIQITAETEYYPKMAEGEPNYFDEMMHITEKTWRNVSFGMPFVLLSHKNSLKEIRRLGFKTFHTLIDESYDEMDDSVRMDYAIDAATELLKHYGTDELNNILQYNKSLIYNDEQMKLLFEKESLEPLKKYINNLDN